MSVLIDSPLPNKTYRGKVRDTYDLGERLLIVATDRISAFDYILPTGIPEKGKVLSQMSSWWFDRTKAVVPNHFIRLADGTAADELPFAVPPELIGRTTIAKKAKRIDVECIVRGYLAGSAWAENTPVMSDLPLVLIVDDNDRNRKLAVDVLRLARFRTLEAVTAAEAIALASEHLPDVILMDLRLPDLDGTEAARMLRAAPRTSRIPVVAVTALRLDVGEDWLFEAGFAGCLMKPIDIDTFPDAVRRFCAHTPE